MDVEHSALGHALDERSADPHTPLLSAIRHICMYVGRVFRCTGGMGKGSSLDLCPCVLRSAGFHECRSEAAPADVFSASLIPLLHEGAHGMKVPRLAPDVDLDLADEHPSSELWRVEVAFVPHLLLGDLNSLDEETVGLLQLPLVEADHGPVARAFASKTRALGQLSTFDDLCLLVERACGLIHNFVAPGVPDREDRCALEPETALLNLLQTHVTEALCVRGEERGLRGMLRCEAVVPRYRVPVLRGQAVAQMGGRVTHVGVVVQAASLLTRTGSAQGRPPPRHVFVGIACRQIDDGGKREGRKQRAERPER
mmetsp:Transcript_79518/g.206579  ORF Transcript_79518/g.206579 Transcript_79518/m.206579 type:complete len:312 (+) Transcript_79518:1256-2191(+)